VAAELKHPARRPVDRRAGDQHMVILVDSVDAATARAIGYVRSAHPKSAGAVTFENRYVASWSKIAPDIPITVEDRKGSLSADLRSHLRERRKSLPEDDFMTIVIPELLDKRGLIEIVRSPRKHRLKASLLAERGVQVLDIPILKDEIDRPIDETREPLRNYVIVLVSGVHNATLQAIEYAETLDPSDLRAVTFGLDVGQAEHIGNEWLARGIPIPLEMQEAAFREIGESLKRYVERFEPDGVRRVVTVILPEFVVRKMRHQLLHGQTALLVKRHLLFERGVVVASVPYYVEV
jgi:hypothetical protein